MKNLPPKDLVRNTLIIVLLGILIVACFWIMLPFLPALIWATMIVIATWPLLLAVEQKVRGRKPAVVVMMALLVLVFVIPFSLAVSTIVQNVPQLTDLGKQVATYQIPPPPDWVDRVPLVGHQVADYWQKAAATGQGEIARRLSPYLRGAGTWLLAQAGSFGMMVIHFILTLVLTALLYHNGEAASGLVRRLAHRIAEEKGENAILLAAMAVRAVAQGVVITALIQSILAGLGLAVVGIPYAALLTALIFMLTIAQLGPGPIMIPATIWLFWKGSTGWGIAMLVWSIFVMGMDGFLRPILIRRNANLPLLLIFAGVIGGLISFGIIGLFIGPVLLAVCYTLMTAWIEEDASQPAPQEAFTTSERD
jgi:predicted PurR-regulated permease PerM